jgi:hypothetical protein
MFMSPFFLNGYSVTLSRCHNVKHVAGLNFPQVLQFFTNCGFGGKL